MKRFSDPRDGDADLLPCPFCGSPGEVVNPRNVGAFYAQCSNYMCFTHPRTEAWKSRAKVAKQWNTRAEVKP